MIKILLMLSLAPTAASAQAIPDFVSSTGQPWKLLWHDEFDGQKLDESKWTFGLPWGGTDGAHRHHNDLYASYMAEHNVVVSDGKLQLLTRREDVQARNGKVFNYTQAMVHTDGKFRLKHGYWEVRAKLPTEAGPGLWPAFWTLSTGWPPEMDILEIWTSGNRSHQGMCYRGSDGKVKWDDYNDRIPLPTEWTTYGMEWGPGYQVYYIDGRVKKRLHGDHVTDVEHYILLNSGVESGNLPTSATIFPNAFQIDYVRVYARPEAPVVHNAGFEQDAMAPWTKYGRCDVVAYGARSGRCALRLDGGPSGSEQKLFGLKPGTTYVLRGFCRSIGTEAEARIGVKNHGHPEAAAAATAADYSVVEVEFTTGSEATTATIYCYFPGGQGAAMFDDLSVTEQGQKSSARL